MLAQLRADEQARVAQLQARVARPSQNHVKVRLPVLEFSQRISRPRASIVKKASSASEVIGLLLLLTQKGSDVCCPHLLIDAL